MAVLTRIPDLWASTSMNDIYETLVNNGGPVSYDLTSFFGVDANINPWSKRKPVVDRLNVQLAVMTTEDMAKQYSSGGSVVRRYGVEMMGGQMTPELVYMGVKANNGLGYKYPLPRSGDLSTPMRLSDFCGYYPAAQMPLETTFADGFRFPYVATDYVLAGFELAEGQEEGQLYRTDLYPTENADGDATQMRRGIYIRTTGGYELTVVGGLNFLSGSFMSTALNNLAGKTFEIMEFITNAPDGWQSIGTIVDDWTRSGYWCYALPMPLSTCSMESSSGGGDVPTYKVAKCVITTPPYFVGGVYTYVHAAFKISSKGNLYSGGTVNRIYCGIYEDAACTIPIERKYFDDVTLGADQETSVYNVAFTNTTGSAGVYFGVWFLGELQYSGNIITPVTPIAE